MIGAVGLLAVAGVIMLGPHSTGLGGWGRRHLIPLAAGLATAVGAAVLTGSPPASLLAGATALVIPGAVRSRREQRIALARRRAWPEALEVVRAQLRAGATVSSAVARAATDVPDALVGPFTATAADLATGRGFEAAARHLAPAGDPVGRRVVMILVLADQVGGADTGRIVGESVAFLRADLAQWREVQARHSWNVAAARIALAAPWLTLLALSAHPAARAAYTAPAGIALLTVVALVTALAYLAMTRIAAAGNRP